MIDPSEYGTETIDRVTLNRIFDKAQLSDEDRETLYLRIGEEWTYDRISTYIGAKYHNKPEGWWEGTIRYRVKKLLEQLNAVVQTA